MSDKSYCGSVSQNSSYTSTNADNCKPVILNYNPPSEGAQGTIGKKGIQGIQGIYGPNSATECCCSIELNLTYGYLPEFGEDFYQYYKAYTECGESPTIIWQTLVDGVWVDVDTNPLPNDILIFDFYLEGAVGPGSYRAKIPAPSPDCCDAYSEIITLFAV